MPRVFDDDRWKSVVELAQAAAGISHADRLVFVQSRSSDPEVVREALALAGSLDKPKETSRRIGTQIGHFILTEYLGSGGMGEVYAARDVELERVVAIKFLNPEWSGLPGAEEKFVREARTASALNHPNIVTVHEVIRSDSTIAIVMERVEGVPLRRLCGEPLPVRQVVNIGQQITLALAAAHAAGIMHRDIKPENVMLRPDGRLKVLDFGLARWSDQVGQTHHSTHTGLPAGTWRYMSPEHYKNELLTNASDVFALGLVLFELSTGGHPFPAALPLEALHAIANQQAPVPSTRNPLIPGSLDSLILAMLAKDPAERPTARAVAAALKDNESTGSVTVPVSRPGRNTNRLIAFVAVLLAIAGLLIWSLRTSRDTQVEFQQITTLMPENRATAAAISPDGKFLVYANADGLFLRVIENGETNALNGPRDFAVDHLAWLPDGAKMIVSGFSEATNRPAIWSVSITGGLARELRKDARFGVPSPNGSRIAFLSADYSSIWTVAIGGEEQRQVLQGPQEDTFLSVVWSSDGRHLQFQRRHYSGQLDNGFVMFDRFYERSFESVNAETGKVVSSLRNLWVQSAASLPDGRILLLRLASPGAPASNQLWETRVDPVSGTFAGSLQKSAIQADDKGRLVGLSTTADGATVMILREVGQAAVFVADFQPIALRFSNIRRLTLDERSNYPHAWTEDSSSVIFESNRNGSWDIFRQRIDERVPDALVATPKRWEVLPQLSPDGKYVLYAAGPANGDAKPYTLMRVPVEGGPVQQVETNGPLDEFRCSLRRSGRCIVRTTVNRDYLVYSELDPVRGIGRELARTAWLDSVLWNWDVSPDGALVAVPNHDSRSARIRIVRLDAQPTGPRERELNLPGLANIAGLTWTADGAGWFVSVTTPVGKRLLYCDLEGRVHLLGDINGWVVPSPNGKRVAYLNTMLETNAWTAKRR